MKALSIRIGQQFNYLIVKSHIPKKGYLCACRCGNEIISKAHALKDGSTQSCGCLKKERLRQRKLDNSQADKNSVYRSYKYSALKRGHDFLLSKEEFLLLIEDNCSYCGDEPSMRWKRFTSNFVFNGVDRVNNNSGYETGNCVTSCLICNRAKNIMTDQEFRAWIKRISNFQTRKRNK